MPLSWESVGWSDLDMMFDAVCLTRFEAQQGRSPLNYKVNVEKVWWCVHGVALTDLDFACKLTNANDVRGAQVADVCQC